MDNINHPILQQAIDKHAIALAEAEKWSHFIQDYKGLANIDEQMPLPLKKVQSINATELKQELTWPEIRRLAEDLLSKKAYVTNAAAFVAEFEKLGYVATKEVVSACLPTAPRPARSFLLACLFFSLPPTKVSSTSTVLPSPPEGGKSPCGAIASLMRCIINQADL